MADPSLIERQLERYRKLLYGATDPMLTEGLRKLIAELEAKLAPPSAPAEGTDPGDDGDLFEPAR